uniref:Ankyrin n=1 Tax=Parastrongyloides trichosuri TaxID=131310 RepID=A0A0N4ZBR0_PARTI
MLEEWYSFDYILMNYTLMEKDKRLGIARILGAYYINLELGWPLEELPSLLSWNDKVEEKIKSGRLKRIDRKIFVNALSLGYEPAIAAIMLLKEGQDLEVMYFLSHFMDVRSDLIVRILLDGVNKTKKTIAGDFFKTRIYHLIDICIQNYKIIEKLENNIELKIKEEAIQLSKSIMEIDSIFNEEILISTLNYSCKVFEKWIISYNASNCLWNYNELPESEILIQLNQKLYFLLNLIIFSCMNHQNLLEFLDILDVYINYKTEIRNEVGTNDNNDGGENTLKINYDVLDKAFNSHKVISIFLEVFLLLVKMEYTQNFKEEYRIGNETKGKEFLKEIYYLFGEDCSGIKRLKLGIENSGKFCEISRIILRVCRKIGKEKVMRETNDAYKYQKTKNLEGDKLSMYNISPENLATEKYNERMKSKPIIGNCNSKLLQFSCNLDIYKLYEGILDDDIIFKRMHFIYNAWTLLPIMSSGLIPLKINLEPKLFINIKTSESALHYKDIINALKISKDFKSHDILIEKITKTLSMVKKTVEEVENKSIIENNNKLMIRYNLDNKYKEKMSKINNHALYDAAMMMSKAKSIAKESVEKERLVAKDIRKQIDLKNSLRNKILEITVSKDDIFPENNDEDFIKRDKEDKTKQNINVERDNISFDIDKRITKTKKDDEIKIIDKLNVLNFNKEKVIPSSSTSSNSSTSFIANKLSASRMKRRVKRIRKNNANNNTHSNQMPTQNYIPTESSSFSLSSQSSISSSHLNYDKELIYPINSSCNIGPQDVINEESCKPPLVVTRLDLDSVTSPSPERKIKTPSTIGDSPLQTNIPKVPFSDNLIFDFKNNNFQTMSTRSETNSKNLTSNVTIPDWLCMLPLDSTRKLHSTRVLTIQDRNLLKGKLKSIVLYSK